MTGGIKMTQPSLFGEKKAPVSDATLFAAYLQRVAPELAQKAKPFRKTPKGYATTNSPYEGVGRFEYDTHLDQIIHSYPVHKYVGSYYEVEIAQKVHQVERLEDRAIIR